jgi:Ras family protein A
VNILSNAKDSLCFFFVFSSTKKKKKKKAKRLTLRVHFSPLGHGSCATVRLLLRVVVVVVVAMAVLRFGGIRPKQQNQKKKLKVELMSDSESESHSDDEMTTRKPPRSSTSKLGSWNDWCSAADESERKNRPAESVPMAKVVMNGPMGGGKTTFLGYLLTGEFQDEYLPTMVNEFVWKVQQPNAADVYMTMWDTFGRADYDRLRPLIYPQTDLMVLCFDVASRDMFDSMFEKYLPEVNHFIPNTPIVLLGLKADLRDDAKVKAMLAERSLTIPTRKEIESRASKFNMKYFEVSTKNDPQGVTRTIEAFGAIIAHEADKAAKKKQKQQQQQGLGGWFRRLFKN